MRASRLSMLLCCLALFCGTAFAQNHDQDAAAIKQVLTDQQSAWNRGDIDTFMHGYKNSAETTFIGKSIAYGYEPILERYKKNYSSHDAMGKLDFSDVTVKMLGENYAVVTGKFNLTRTAAGGGDASGIYSLVFERQYNGERQHNGERDPEGWKIILDHSSSSN
jgi:ketosteroid isomerase-like protein